MQLSVGLFAAKCKGHTYHHLLVTYSYNFFGDRECEWVTQICQLKYTRLVCCTFVHARGTWIYVGYFNCSKCWNLAQLPLKLVIGSCSCSEARWVSEWPTQTCSCELECMQAWMFAATSVNQSHPCLKLASWRWLSNSISGPLQVWLRNINRQVPQLTEKSTNTSSSTLAEFDLQV